MHPINHASSLEAILHTAPIPAHWIKEGRPHARSGELWRSLDGTMATCVWDCTAGTFEWYFGCEETVHIIDGAVRVLEACGTERTLKAGDVAVFHAGTTATWRVDSYVRKVAMCRYPVPAPLALAYRCAGKVVGKLKRLVAHVRRPENAVQIVLVAQAFV